MSIQMGTAASIPTITIRRLAPLAFALALGACGSLTAMTGGSAPAKTVDGVYVGAGGMTLYTFDRDAAGSGRSVCNGPCATLWPPLTAGADATATGDWTVVTRDDGSRQWALRGKPLYYWSKNSRPGDRTGDGFNDVWRVAKP